MPNDSIASRRKRRAEAQALAVALSSYGDIDRELAAYNAARQPLSELIVAHGRKLGTQLGVNLVTEEDRRMSKLLQRPNAVLDWIASRTSLLIGPE